jgi:GNAT superfamily N-acetyltransferase
MIRQLLDNIVWRCLTGPHAALSSGTAAARRYARGLAPILGFADNAAPDFSGLAAHCAPGEHLYCGGWSGSAPPGWRVEGASSMHQMVWDGETPAHGPTEDSVQLGPEHVAQMLELVAATQPGPFGARALEFGEYHGVFADNRLVAMAGERMAAGRLREVSAVCTLPAFQGRGLARRLVEKLVRRQLARGQTPFLHVVEENLAARRLYERMGFALHQTLAVRVVSRVG